MGTAVNVQAMAMAHRRQLRSGVAFTRTRLKRRKGFLRRILKSTAQGEDVGPACAHRTSRNSKPRCPRPYAEPRVIRKTLESHFKDVQDSKSRLKRGSCHALRPQWQTPGLAAVRSPSRWKRKSYRLEDGHSPRARRSLDQVLAPVLIARPWRGQLHRQRACPPAGGASGRCIFTPNGPLCGSKGEKSLARGNETSPEDLRGMSPRSILTAKAALAHTAALVADRWARSASAERARCK